MKRLHCSARTAAVVLSALLLAPGCGTRGALYTGNVAPLPFLATSGALVQVVPQTARAVIVPPGGEAPRSVPISGGARAAVLAPTREFVAIIGGTAKEPKLDLVQPGEPGSTEDTVLTQDLPGAFDTIHFSPDARIGVLTYATGVKTGLVARNLNEIAVTDFGTLAGPVRMQLDTESLAPRSVVFAPAEDGRQLVAVTFERGVAVFDALAPQRQARRINIRARDGSDTTSVLEALFSPDGHFLFVRASGVDDVIVIELGTDPAGELTASVNFVSGGTGLADIALPRGDRADDSVLAIYSLSRELVLLDARGIEDNVLRLPLDASLTQLRVLADGNVLAFSPSSKTVAAWNPGSQQSGSAVLDGLFDPQVLVSEPMQRAVFRHTSGNALSVISVEDGVNRLKVRIQSIQLTVPGSAFSLDSFEQTLLFATRAESGQSPALVRMPLATLELAQVDLDAATSDVLHLPGKASIALIHSGNPYGDVTFLPEGSLDRTAAVRVTDTALTGDLDRAFPEENQ